MRNLIFIWFLFFSFVFVNSVSCNNGEHIEIEKLAKEVKDAVIKKDINRLMKYVSPSGVYFIDDKYTYEQIEEIIRKKNSWLYKHLFVGENSVINYFQKANDLEIKIHHRNSNAIFVSYHSSNVKPVNWLECCFIKIKGKWYFDGIFSCE
jgi:hypothetical protein